MKIAGSRGRIAVVAIVGLAVLGGAALLLIASTTQAADKNPLAGLLGKTGLTYHKLDDESWLVPFDTKENKTIEVFVTYADSKKKFALVFTTVVDEADKFDYSKAVLVECMKMNNDYPGVKFCLDYDSGAIDCQSEILMTNLDAKVLADYINRVASMADSSSQTLNELIQK